MEQVSILWADDEIDLLKPHILFLESKGFKVLTATNGEDALDLLNENTVDIVFLDENMPGMTGLEVLPLIKSKRPQLPVIMITKSEEEYIMEDAIGSKISDYLIKPVNPNQILLSIKKNLDNKRLVSEKTTSNYQQKFRELGMRLNDRLDANEWVELYKELIYWELELEKANQNDMADILQMQKSEANQQFFKFIQSNYGDWVQDSKHESTPTLSNTILERKLLPNLSEQKSMLIVIDNLRLDQWQIIKPIVTEYYRVQKEETFFSILPTATQYARNALFAGLMPLEIQKMYPKLWKNDDDEGGKNMHENEFFEGFLKRNNQHTKYSYHKITNLTDGKKLAEGFHKIAQNPLNVVVYNFVDMLSHARTEMEVIRELADDEKAYRSLTLSWFMNSPLLELIKQCAQQKIQLFITTDHGTIRVKNPSKIVGDKNTNTNLRYKQGKSLNYNEKEVFAFNKPEDFLLPKINVSSRYVFAKENFFFAYPNNYNYYVNYYRDTFQHGGVSLEEIIIPFVQLQPK